MIQITNECNMELMSRYPDNYFGLYEFENIELQNKFNVIEIL